MDPPHGSTIMMLAEAGRKRRVGTEDMWTARPFGSPFSSPRPSGERWGVLVRVLFMPRPPTCLWGQIMGGDLLRD